jgi:hypothetical protein
MSSSANSGPKNPPEMAAKEPITRVARGITLPEHGIAEAVYYRVIVGDFEARWSEMSRRSEAFLRESLPARAFGELLIDKGVGFPRYEISGLLPIYDAPKKFETNKYRQDISTIWLEENMRTNSRKGAYGDPIINVNLIPPQHVSKPVIPHLAHAAFTEEGDAWVRFGKGYHTSPDNRGWETTPTKWEYLGGTKDPTTGNKLAAKLEARGLISPELPARKSIFQRFGLR